MCNSFRALKKWQTPNIQLHLSSLPLFPLTPSITTPTLSLTILSFFQFPTSVLLCHRVLSLTFSPLSSSAAATMNPTEISRPTESIIWISEMAQCFPSVHRGMSFSSPHPHCHISASSHTHTHTHWRLDTSSHSVAECLQLLIKRLVVYTAMGPGNGVTVI